MAVDKGYIYIIHNEMYKLYGNDVYKIGKTNDIHNRINAYTTSYIKPVEIICLSEECINYTLAEKYIFYELREFRLVPNREFFKVPRQTLIEVLESVVSRVNNGTIACVPSGLMTVEDRIEALRIAVDDYDTYKEIVINQQNYDEHNNIILWLSSDDHIHSFKSRTSKLIQVLRMVENTYDITPLDLSYDKLAEITMTDDMFTQIKSAFRTQKRKPTNEYELIKLYVGAIKSITCNDIIITTRNKKKQEGKRDCYEFELNSKLIVYHLELNRFKDDNSHIKPLFLTLYCQSHVF